MHILFADAFHSDYADIVRERGHACTFEPGLSADDLPAAIGGHDVLVVRSTKVTARAIEAAGGLGLIIRAGAGTNTIDKRAAAARGIYVCNVPGRNAIAVAELAFGLVMSLDRRIPDNVADLRAGTWNKKRYSKAEGLYGRTVGVVGLGDIGLAFAERAAAFGLEVRAIARPHRPPSVMARAEHAGITFVDDLSTLAATCDILSFHVPLTDDTQAMIDAELLAHVRPGSWIINTSRGEIVDEDALLDALDARDLRAGLDVYREEPPSSTGTFDSALARHPRVYGTHHIGASTEQAQRAIAAEVVAMLDAYARGEVRNCVNIESQPVGNATLVVRHLDQVGVLSDVLNVLRRCNLNIEQMHNVVFAGRTAAVATIHTAGTTPDDLADQLNAVDRVLHVSVQVADGTA
ncbi:MAG: hydroxyacid dehydrogenase [Actinobacteria bacterium]|nr:hydroxyacid dehydrogenase [Actinomycetota bacterium]